MPVVLVVLASVTAIPLLLMIATCLLERMESVLVPRAGRVVRAAAPAGSPRRSPASAVPAVGSSRHLRLVRGDGDGPVDPDFDPDATAQLRRVS